jgi:hypothetical protein
MRRRTSTPAPTSATFVRRHEEQPAAERDDQLCVPS